MKADLPMAANTIAAATSPGKPNRWTGSAPARLVLPASPPAKRPIMSVSIGPGAMGRACSDEGDAPDDSAAAGWEGTSRHAPVFAPWGSAERAGGALRPRSEEHTSELQSLMRISYAVFCLKKKNKNNP